MPSSGCFELLNKRSPAPGLLFTSDDRHYLTRNRFVRAVKDGPSVAGVDASKYAGHSFRIRAAMSAANCGVQDSLINTKGWWESTVYTL